MTNDEGMTKHNLPSCSCLWHIADQGSGLHASCGHGSGPSTFQYGVPRKSVDTRRAAANECL